MYASLYASTAASRWSYFTFGFGMKCIGIFAAEMAALIASKSHTAPPAAAAAAKAD